MFLGETCNWETGSVNLSTGPYREVRYSGFVAKIKVGEAIAVADLLYLDKTDDEFKKVDAALGAAFDEGARCIALAAGTDGTYIKAFFLGYIRIDSISALSLTPGDIVWAGETAGAMTPTKPSTATDKAQKVATALSATELLFNPSLEYETI